MNLLKDDAESMEDKLKQRKEGMKCLEVKDRGLGEDQDEVLGGDKGLR